MRPIDSRPVTTLSEYQISKILHKYNIENIFTEPYLQLEMDGMDLKNIIKDVVAATAKKVLGKK
jgi:hypothetical protein